MKKLVLGLGNPILGDDGVGFRVARAVKEKVSDEEATVIESSSSGLGLLDLLYGYKRAIIIDAIQSKEGKTGEVYHLKVEDFDTTRHASSLHVINLATALKVGKKLGIDIPERISIIAIEIPKTYYFSEELSSRVKKAIPRAVDMVIAALKEPGEPF